MSKFRVLPLLILFLLLTSCEETFQIGQQNDGAPAASGGYISGSTVRRAVSYQTNDPESTDKFMRGDFAGAVDSMVSPVDSDCPPPSLAPTEPIRPRLRIRQPGDNSEERTAREEHMRELKEDLERDNDWKPFFETDDEWFAHLTSDPPKDCRYKLSGFSRSQVGAICQGMNQILQKKKVTCHVSNCTTASFFGVIKQLMTRPDFESKWKNRLSCRSPFPRAYLVYAEHGLKGFAQEYGLDEGGGFRRLVLESKSSSNKSDILKQAFDTGLPQLGDPLLLQRDGSKGRTAHSVIFSHFLTDSGQKLEKGGSGKITKVCYWSSNTSTNGSGNRCESVSYMSFIDSARITTNAKI